MSNNHYCNQGPRFTSLEEAIKGIHETLKQLTELIISQAKANTKLEALIELIKDHETRIRSLEDRSASTRWIERLSWAGLVGAVGAYFKFKSGG
jgi:chromosome segregation ATPase